jgi:hypothetical protein
MGAPMNDTAQTLTDQFRLAVDYGLTLPQMIAAGHYGWTNPGITSVRFPTVGTGVGRVEAKLFHFDRYHSSETAVTAIKTTDVENPWRPAKIEHLLSFGVTHPDEQRTYPIVALGSVAEVVDNRHVVYLRRYVAGHRLNLEWWNGDWADYCRFLAVRNLSSDT